MQLARGDVVVLSSDVSIRPGAAVLALFGTTCLNRFPLSG